MTLKGWGCGVPWQRAESEPAWYHDALATLQPDWWYNWKWDQVGKWDNYYPMIWRCDMEWVARALPAVKANADRMWLLGNEPERADQSNTDPHTFAAAVDALRHAVGSWAVPIALPGILWNDHGQAWLREYLEAGGAKPDAWHFHVYCSTAGQVSSMVDHMIAVYGDRPIIISEVAGAVDGANEDVMRGVRNVLADGRIQAAAWFSAYYDKWEAPSLLTESGKLTRLGDMFIEEQHTVYLPGVHG
jgi:hypothetical protein